MKELVRLNKKGFTLAELIAVIVVVALLLSLGVTSFIRIRKGVLEKEYNNLVSYLELKAQEYAKETDIMVISVSELIVAGVVTPDDGWYLYSPIDDEIMNCYIIRTKYEKGEYVSKISEKIDMKDGVCSEYAKETDYQLCHYEEDKCSEIKSDMWFNQDIIVGVKKISEEQAIMDALNYTWSSTNGLYENTQLIQTKTYLIGKNTYRCDLEFANKKGVAVGVVNIDKHAPEVIEINYNHNRSLSKEVEIVATDSGESGIDKYSLVKKNEDCKFDSTSNVFTINENADYKYCIMDKAGNYMVGYFTVDSVGEPITLPEEKDEDKYTCDEGTLIKDESLGYVCAVALSNKTEEFCTIATGDDCPLTCQTITTSNCASYTKYCTKYGETCTTIANGNKICIPSGKCISYSEFCSKFETKEECYRLPCTKCYDIPKLCEDGWSVGSYYCYKVATKVE